MSKTPEILVCHWLTDAKWFHVLIPPPLTFPSAPHPPLQASVVVACGLESASSVVVVYGLCCFMTYEIFLEQGLNPWLPWLLHWLVDFYPLCHQGSPIFENTFLASSDNIVWLYVRQVKTNDVSGPVVLNLWRRQVPFWISHESVEPLFQGIMCSQIQCCISFQIWKSPG